MYNEEISSKDILDKLNEKTDCEYNSIHIFLFIYMLGHLVYALLFSDS
jgi:hypothetical protein